MQFSHSKKKFTQAGLPQGQESQEKLEIFLNNQGT